MTPRYAVQQQANPGPITTWHHTWDEALERERMLINRGHKAVAFELPPGPPVTVRYGDVEWLAPTAEAAHLFALRHTRDTGEPVEVHTHRSPTVFRRPTWRTQAPDPHPEATTHSDTPQPDSGQPRKPHAGSRGNDSHVTQEADQ